MKIRDYLRIMSSALSSFVLSKGSEKLWNTVFSIQWKIAALSTRIFKKIKNLKTFFSVQREAILPFPTWNEDAKTGCIPTTELKPQNSYMERIKTKWAFASSLFEVLIIFNCATNYFLIAPSCNVLWKSVVEICQFFESQLPGNTLFYTCF